MKKVLILITILLSQFVNAQHTERFYSIFTNDEIEKANTAKRNDTLSTSEKEVITISNLFRLYPQKIAEKYLIPYYDSAKNERTSYTKSLISDLKKSKSITSLTFHNFYYKAAKEHAEYMGKKGQTGHHHMDKRLKGWKKFHNNIAENCSYGKETAFEIVMQLMIDEGVSSLGHRKNILNPNLQFVGISIAPHKKYNTNCVMDMGGVKIR